MHCLRFDNIKLSTQWQTKACNVTVHGDVCKNFGDQNWREHEHVLCMLCKGFSVY